MQILHNTCSCFGFNILFSKTKTQLFNNEKLANLASLFKIGDNTIDRKCISYHVCIENV